jgi:hypothetical protein
MEEDEARAMVEELYLILNEPGKYSELNRLGEVVGVHKGRTPEEVYVQFRGPAVQQVGKSMVQRQPLSEWKKTLAQAAKWNFPVRWRSQDLRSLGTRGEKWPQPIEDNGKRCGFKEGNSAHRARLSPRFR